MTFHPLLRRVGAFVLAAFAAALPVHAADRADQRVQFREALATAAKPPEGAWKSLSAGLEEAGYPLTPYIELAALRLRIGQLEPGEVERFLGRWPDSLAASDLREAYLRELARRNDWTAFRALWKGQPGARPAAATNCRRASPAGAKLDYAADIDALWQGSQALPGACDAVLRARTPGRRAERGARLRTP